MTSTRPCPSPDSCPGRGPEPAGPLLSLRWAFSATALAAIAACGGGGGGAPSEPANEAPTVVIDAPAANASFAVGEAIRIAATAADRDGSVVRVEFFSGTTKIGEDTTAPFELVWANAPAGSHNITVRAIDNASAVGLSASLPLNVTTAAPAPPPPGPPAPPPPGPNQAPTVALDDPVAGPTAPATMTLTASASDSDGSVAKVEFLDGAVLLGQGTLDAATSKYRLVLNARPAGTYLIIARATDNLGGTSTSASKTVTIAPNVPPTVAMSSAASFDLPAAVTLTATASDSDGIAKVEFFNGATRLGEDLSAPYEFTWAGAVAGNYSITARATDIHGNATTSAVQSVVVNPDTAGMWATLNQTQKAGLTMVPNRLIEAGGVDAGEVMTVIGTNTIIPSFSAALAQSARALAELAAVIPAGQTSVTVPCPGGGTLQVALPTGATLSSPNRIHNYNNCVIGGFSFYGGAGMTPYIQYDTTTPFPPPAGYNPNCVNEAGPPRRYRCSISSTVDYTQLSATSFRFVISALRVTGNGAPDPGGKDWPRNALPYSTVTCTVNGATKSCQTNLAVTFLWGNDLSWSGFSDNGTVPPATNYAVDDRYVLSGTQRSHYCSPDPTLPNNGRDACLANPPAARHIRFEGMTNISGRAIVYGSNGWSVVTRLTPAPAPAAPGTERLRVVRTITQAVTVNGIVYPVGTATPEIWRCAVGAATGDWACLFETYN